MSILHEWIRVRTIHAEAQAKERVIRAEAWARERDIQAWRCAVMEANKRAEKLATSRSHREGGEAYSSMSYSTQHREFARLLSALMAARPTTLTETQALRLRPMSEAPERKRVLLQPDNSMFMGLVIGWMQNDLIVQGDGRLRPRSHYRGWLPLPQPVEPGA